MKIKDCENMHCCLVSKPCLTLCNLVALQPTRLLCPWNSPGKSTGVGCHFLLQENFLTQRPNSCPCIGRWILYCWATRKVHMTISVVHLLSHVQLFATPWTAAQQTSLSFTISWSLLKLMSIFKVTWFQMLWLRRWVWKIVWITQKVFIEVKVFIEYGKSFLPYYINSSYR